MKSKNMCGKTLFGVFFLQIFTQFPDILQSRKISKAKQVAFVQILFLNHLKKILE